MTQTVTNPALASAIQIRTCMRTVANYIECPLDENFERANQAATSLSQLLTEFAGHMKERKHTNKAPTEDAVFMLNNGG